MDELEASLLAWGFGRVASGSDADALRALRAAYRETFEASVLYHLPVKDSQGNRYRLFFRDTIPYEDGWGLIRAK